MAYYVSGKTTNKTKKKRWSLTTKLADGGRDPFAHAGFVNIPCYRGSTIQFADLDTLDGKKPVSVRYGLQTTPLLDALKEMLTALEGGEGELAKGCVLVSSGLEAVTLPMLALLDAGDHLLVTDGAYTPTHNFVERMLPRFGISHERYDPTDLPRLEEMIKANKRSKMIWAESPSSQTFEMTDLPALSQIAKRHGLISVADNSWGGGIAMRPLELGIDISVQSATKYVSGHSDTLMGFCVANSKELVDKMEDARSLIGIYNASEDASMCLRGLRTLNLRYHEHGRAGLTVCDFLAQQPEVRKILHPAHPSHPQHKIWQRDCHTTCGLFSILIEKKSRAALASFIDGLELFGLGYSWGGYKSLLDISLPQGFGRRCLADVPEDCWLIRFHIGLENCQDLINDLRAGFERYRAAKS